MAQASNAYHRAYYAEHLGAERKSARRHKASKSEWINTLKDRPCDDCGDSHPSYVMDWHHRVPDEKFRSVASMQTYSRERILAEIEKCDLLCANCHRKRHYESVVEQADHPALNKGD